MDTIEAYKRAGGRRRCNKQRTQVVQVRRFMLRLALMECHYIIDTRWIEAQAISEGVSTATIYRDLRALGVRKTLAAIRIVWGE